MVGEQLPDERLGEIACSRWSGELEANWPDVDAVTPTDVSKMAAELRPLRSTASHLQRRLKDATEECGAYRHVLDAIAAGEAIDPQAMAKAVIVEQDIVRGRDSEDLPDEAPEIKDLTFDEIDTRIRDKEADRG